MADRKQQDEAAPVHVTAQEFLKNVKPWPEMVKELQDAFPGLMQEQIDDLVP